MSDKERQLAPRCAWALDCERAVNERWDPFAGRYRPACAMHARLASPMELRALREEARELEAAAAAIAAEEDT